MASFYTDENIALETARQLGGLGHVVVRCQDVGRIKAPDDEHLVYAAERGYILITHDRDFIQLSPMWKRWTRAGLPNHPGILVIPDESLWLPHLAAYRIDEFMRRNDPRENACYLFNRGGSWTQY